MWDSYTAIRNSDPDVILLSLQHWASKNGVKAEIMDLGPPIREERGSTIPDYRYGNVLVYPAKNQWTRVEWPTHFLGPAGAASLSLSKEAGDLVSHCEIADSVWMHFLMKNGEVLDQFCQMPDFFESKSSEFMKLWSGNFRYSEDVPDGTKHAKDDTYEIYNALVFWDFWKHCGISAEQFRADYHRKSLRFLTEVDRLPDLGIGI